MKISVLTATYNRSKHLKKLYDSLLENKKFSNLEWLIMDDGSTDDTELTIKKLDTKKIKIKYFKQKNQGKMTAINNLLEHVTGDLIIECDSDDYFTKDAFKEILDKYSTIKKDNKIYGLIMLKLNQNQKLIGNKFKKEGELDTIFNFYNNRNIYGDKCIVYKADIRKKYKHKLEDNEKFVTEARLTNEMDEDYKGVKCFNSNIQICEYKEDGYSKNIDNLFKTYPKGYYKYFEEILNKKKYNFKKRYHYIKQYILFSYLSKYKKTKAIRDMNYILNKVLTTLLIIPGYILSKKRFKDNKKKVLFISSTGGHLGELLQLKTLFDNYNYHIITEKDKTTKNMVSKYGNRIDYLVYGTKDNLLRYIFVFPYNILRSLYLFLKIRPKVIISTGAHTCVPICYIGKLFRRKIIYIETFANSETKTLTGRLIYPIANTFIVQWESMLKLYPKAIYGGWIY